MATISEADDDQHTNQVMLSVHSDEHFMKLAILEAKKAAEEGEIPVGAVIVADNRVIAKAYNQVEKLNDVTAHAEMLAVTSAQNYLGSKYLENCKMYVTLEPCTMCAGAAFWTQLERIIVSARDPSRGFSRLSPDPLHPKTQSEFGLLEHESVALMKAFFKSIRGNNN